MICFKDSVIALYCLPLKTLRPPGGQRSNHWAPKGTNHQSVIDYWLVFLVWYKLHTSTKLMSSLHVRRFTIAVFRCPHLSFDSTYEPIRCQVRGGGGGGGGRVVGGANTDGVKGAFWTHPCWFSTQHMMVCLRTREHLRSDSGQLKKKTPNPKEKKSEWGWFSLKYI